MKVFGGSFGKVPRKVFEGNLAKCQESFWRQIYEMPLILNSGIPENAPKVISWRFWQSACKSK
jgi:hypothetical protein